MFFAMGWFDKSVRAAGCAAALCALVVALPASAEALPASAEGHRSAPIAEISHTQPAVSAAERLLVVHNAERLRLGLPPLAWNPSLARDAGDYAKQLLSQGRLQHASISARKGNGENLWMGTAGAWNSDAMVGMFLDERRHFRAATFPDVSLTGNWSDVGHYTQLMWTSTYRIGCAMATGPTDDILVCRYREAGNVEGERAF